MIFIVLLLGVAVLCYREQISTLDGPLLLITAFKHSWRYISQLGYEFEEFLRNRLQAWLVLDVAIADACPAASTFPMA